jgi:NTE family protein
MFLDGEVGKAFLPSSLAWQLIKSTPLYVAKRLMGKQPEIGLYSGDRVEKLIAKALPPGKNRIENFTIPFAAICTNLLDTRPVWLGKGDAASIMRASTSIPIIYRPVMMEGKALVDGGVRENLPTDTATAAGAPVVVAVRLHSSLEAQPEPNFRRLFPYMDRILSIYLSEIEHKATDSANVLVAPEVGHMRLYSFDRTSVANAIEAGEKAAMEQLPRIRTLLRRQAGTASKSSTPGHE